MTWGMFQICWIHVTPMVARRTVNLLLENVALLSRESLQKAGHGYGRWSSKYQAYRNHKLLFDNTYNCFDSNPIGISKQVHAANQFGWLSGGFPYFSIIFINRVSQMQSSPLGETSILWFLPPYFQGLADTIYVLWRVTLGLHLCIWQCTWEAPSLKLGCYPPLWPDYWPVS